ncbi:MAG: glycosyltransferase, partial [Solirubrobacteraceae bacterium]
MSVRLTLLTVGSRGDVQPCVALGLGLQGAGHRVRVATHPRYAWLVESAGLDFAPLAEGQVSAGAETEEGRRWIEAHGRRRPSVLGFWRDARSVAHRRLADAAAACADADAVVAANLAFVAGWQVARLRRLPFVRAFIEPPAWMLAPRAARPLAPVIRQIAWSAGRPWMNGARRSALRAGPLPAREPFGQLDRAGAPALYAFSSLLLGERERLPAGASLTGYWFADRRLDPDPQVELETFLSAGPPPVAVGFSTMIDSDPAATTALVVGALRRAGMRGVLIGGATAPAAAPARDVHIIEAVSHDWLLPRCAAVVHHAAVGTTAAGVRAGIPAVAIPHMGDQYFWARRLHAAGVSPEPIPRRRLSEARLSE